MAGPAKERGGHLSPVEAGVVAGILAILFTIFIPAALYAPSKSVKHRRQALASSPRDEAFRQHMRRNWTEEAVLPKAGAIGLSSGLVVTTSCVVARSLKRRQGG